MKDTPVKDKFLHMRITGDFKLRIEQLMKKKGLDKTGVVNVAVAEMHDREIGEAPKKK